MKYKNLFSAILIIFFIALQSSNTYSLAIFNNQKTAVSPTVSFGTNYQEAYNITNDGLKDFSLLKTAFTLNAKVEVQANYDLSWNYSILNVAGGGGVTWFTIPAGTYNYSLFLGLAYLKNANAPNTIVNGTFNLNFTLIESTTPYTNYGTFQMPEMTFSYNTSKISGRVATFDPLDVMNYPKSPTLPNYQAYYQWDYNNSNVNGAYTMITEIGRKYTADFPNGTIGMGINESLYGFTFGKIYSNNVSLTTDMVPVGYPFSKLIIPSNLSLTKFEALFVQPVGWTNSFNLSSGKLSYNKALSSANWNWTWVYNQSTGVLIDYTYSAPTAYESLHLTESTINITSTSQSTNSTTTSTSTTTTSTSSQTTSTNTSTQTKKTTSTPVDGMYSFLAVLFLSSVYIIRRRKIRK